MTLLGFLIVFSGLVFALVIFLEIVFPPGGPEWRPTSILLSILLGLIFGGPLIVSGELTLIFLDQRQLLGKIHHRLKVWEMERAENLHRGA